MNIAFDFSYNTFSIEKYLGWTSVFRGKAWHETMMLV